MFIEEIEIYNILDCEHVKLNFKQKHSNVYIVQGSSNCPIRQAASTALKLICSAQYASIESLTNFKNLHEGYVRVVLLIRKAGVAADKNNPKNAGAHANTNGAVTTDKRQATNEANSDSDSDAPCTSQQARDREQRRKRRRQQRNMQSPDTGGGCEELSYQRIDALRDFRSNTEVIEYTVDHGEQQKCSLYAFQGKFRTNIDYIFRQPHLSRNDFTGNWLQFTTTKLNGCMNENEDISNLFGQFVQLFLKNHYTECDLLSKLTTCCLIGQNALDVMLATNALKIFNDVRITFEFITCMEYTVWFLIPYKGRYVHVKEVSLENFKFSNICTCIKLKNNANARQTREYVWSNAQHAVQDLLFIAFQLVMSYHLKRGIVYLQEELYTVKDYQTMQFVITAYMQNNENARQLWPKKNYLQRILEACIKMKITAIIDYPGGLPVAPINGHLIKCFKNDTNGKWELKVEENASTCSVEKFIIEVEKGLKDY